MTHDQLVRENLKITYHFLDDRNRLFYPKNFIYFKLLAEKGNIQKNRYSRILDNGFGHLFTPCTGKFEPKRGKGPSEEYSVTYL